MKDDQIFIVIIFLIVYKDEIALASTEKLVVRQQRSEQS